VVGSGGESPPPLTTGNYNHGDIMTLQLINPENPRPDIKLTLCIHLPTCGLPMYIVEDIDAALKWYVEGPRDYVNLDMLTEARDGLMADYSALQIDIGEAGLQIVNHLDSLIAALENPAAFSVEG